MNKGIKKLLTNEAVLSRGVAAALTIGFLTAVRPDHDPGLVASAFIALLFYEAFTYCIRYSMQVKRQSDKCKYMEQKEKMRKEAHAVESQNFKGGLRHESCL